MLKLPEVISATRTDVINTDKGSLRHALTVVTDFLSVVASIEPT